MQQLELVLRTAEVTGGSVDCKEMHGTKLFSRHFGLVVVFDLHLILSPSSLLLLLPGVFIHPPLGDAFLAPVVAMAPIFPPFMWGGGWLGRGGVVRNRSGPIS